MELIFYLFQVNCALLVFYGIYFFLLRHLTFYTLNRYFLLLSLAFAFTYPLIDWKSWLAKFQHASKGSEVDWNQILIQPTQNFDFSSYLHTVLFVVMGALILRFAIRLVSLLQLHRDSRPASWQMFRYRHVFRKISPFSFWKNIYIHSDIHEDHEMRDIISHEMVHIHQLHTLDTLIGELNSIFNWFNPIAWMYKRAIQENLEFLTDQRVLQTGIDKKMYQMSLLQVQRLLPQSALTSSFNVNYLKRRIRMMNKKRSSSLQMINYLVSVPSIILFVLIFTVSKAYHDPQLDLFVQNIVRVQEQPLDTQVMDEEPIKIDSFVVQPTYKKNKVSSAQVDRIVNRVDSVNFKLKPPVAFVDLHPHTLVLPAEKKFKSVKIAISGFNLGAQSVPDSLLGETRRVRVVQGFPSRKSVQGNLFQGKATEYPDKHPYILVDGQESESISNVKPDDILSITVLKEENAIAQFGHKAKNGVIFITTNKSK